MQLSSWNSVVIIYINDKEFSILRELQLSFFVFPTYEHNIVFCFVTQPPPIPHLASNKMNNSNKKYIIIFIHMYMVYDIYKYAHLRCWHCTPHRRRNNCWMQRLLLRQHTGYHVYCRHCPAASDLNHFRWYRTMRPDPKWMCKRCKQSMWEKKREILYVLLVNLFILPNGWINIDSKYTCMV